jgi:hypothetical protein
MTRETARYAIEVALLMVFAVGAALFLIVALLTVLP